jgi:hypothetical protein
MKPPRAAIWLTAAGALPFLAAAAMVMGLWPAALPGSGAGGGAAGGRALALAYGIVILSFMSGVLWGFAARAGAGLWAYAASVLPALHVFFTALPHPWALPGQPMAHLIAGFLLVLVLDAVFQFQRLAPRWWLSLRVPVTVVVLACLWIARHG